MECILLTVGLVVAVGVMIAITIPAAKNKAKADAYLAKKYDEEEKEAQNKTGE